jgi:putative transcriptional regulator
VPRKKKHWSECATEAEEAQWWDKNPGYATELIRAAAASGQLARGKRAIAAVDEAPAAIPQHVDVQAIRVRCRLSQAVFARRYGFSARTVQDWEQGRRKPDAAVRAYLTVIDRNRRAVEQALRKTA